MISARTLVEQAQAQVQTLSPAEAAALLAGGEAVLVDLREAGELRREGRLPGAVHVPRGLLEFQADPASEWHLPALAAGRRLVLFCALGWRSALAARDLQAMGHADVCHLGGGFTAWQQAGLPVERAAPPAREAAPPALAGFLRIQAHANRLANHRLHQAMQPLTHEELHAPRVSFFPSLMGTLNHILAVDGYYPACKASPTPMHAGMASCPRMTWPHWPSANVRWTKG
jgi:rhodanese-related sulfurtransferase